MRIGRILTLFLAGLLLTLPALPQRARAEASCRLDGATLGEGAQALFYSARWVHRGQSCEAVARPRRCDGGRISGDSHYTYRRCIELEEFLGVNVNRRPDQLDPALLARTGTDWIRASADVLRYTEPHHPGQKSQKWQLSDWSAYTAAAQDRSAILNLMWDFKELKERLPRPGSARESEIFAFLDTKILDRLAPSVRIITTGNEPFVNTLEKDQQPDPAWGGAIPLVVFYQRVTEHVDSYLRQRGLRDRVDIYVGSFTRLHTREMRAEPAARQLLAWAAGTDYVDGIDLHTHVQTLDQIDKTLAVVSKATDKPVIVTELSFIWRMRKALREGDRLGRDFAARWGRDPNRLTHAYLICDIFGLQPGCAGRKVSQAEWDDFFRTRDWYIDHFLLRSEEIFRRYGVRGASFGLEQSRPGPEQIALDSRPWYLGFLFSPAAVLPGPGGEVPANYQYLDDFLAIQAARRAAR